MLSPDIELRPGVEGRRIDVDSGGGMAVGEAVSLWEIAPASHSTILGELDRSLVAVFVEESCWPAQLVNPLLEH